MVEKQEVDELREIYRDMDSTGKKEMFLMSKKFMDVQKIIDKEMHSPKKKDIERNVP